MTPCPLINSKEYLNRNSNRTRAFAFVHAGWGGGAGPVAAGVSRGACRRRQVRKAVIFGSAEAPVARRLYCTPRSVRSTRLCLQAAHR